MTFPSRLKRTAILVFIGLVIGIGAGLYQIAFQDARVIRQGSQEDTNTSMAGLKIGGPFTLINQDAQKVTEADYAGSYKLMFFGFTYCPAICPTELQKISRTLKILEQDHPDLASKVQPIFVSIDPERDTPAVMKDYISLYHPRLIGLTGTQPQIDQITRSFRVYAAKVDLEETNDYTMDHSSFIYFMAPGGDVLSIYRMEDRAQEMAVDMLDKMQQPA